jgi:hypothetical protein
MASDIIGGESRGRQPRMESGKEPNEQIDQGLYNVVSLSVLITVLAHNVSSLQCCSTQEYFHWTRVLPEKSTVTHILWSS